MLAQQLLSFVFLVLLPCMIVAQENTNFTCSFSCPTTDKLSRPLVKRPHAIGSESFYSIFECIYLSSNPDLPDPTCSYYKESGLQALGSIYDQCMPTAVACSTLADSKPPMFSSQDRDEVPSWVEIGRYHLYLKENHRG